MYGGSKASTENAENGTFFSAFALKSSCHLPFVSPLVTSPRVLRMPASVSFGFGQPPRASPPKVFFGSHEPLLCNAPLSLPQSPQNETINQPSGPPEASCWASVSRVGASALYITVS